MWFDLKDNSFASSVFLKRPVTTLFMLQSLDGKISTGVGDGLDFDKDLPNIKGVGEGLYQYYDIEKTTDLWSLNSGKTLKKIGVNQKGFKDYPKQNNGVHYVVVDNHNLTKDGIEYLLHKGKSLYIITTNKNHSCFELEPKANLFCRFYEKLDFDVILNDLCESGCYRLTIQTGGTINSLLLRGGFIDYIDVVIAPIIIGGKNTPSLADGEDITTINQLNKVCVLKGTHIELLNNNYIRVKYEVDKDNL